MTTTTPRRSGPILFCTDGSAASGAALAAASELLEPRAAVVLTVWETAAMRLAHNGLAAGLGGAYFLNEGDVDTQEEAAARRAAEHGVQAARERGWQATVRVEEATLAVWRTIADVADEIDASMIVCGTRGRNPVRQALLGSVSEAVLHHGHRPVLISPTPAASRR